VTAQGSRIEYPPLRREPGSHDAQANGSGRPDHVFRPALGPRRVIFTAGRIRCSSDATATLSGRLGGLGVTVKIRTERRAAARIDAIRPERFRNSGSLPEHNRSTMDT
jgi:hypothetical protein